MSRSVYKAQVELLLQVLPEVAKQKCFALHGGTAINLFVRDLPRLSVDIDLTYVPFDDRNIAFKAIDEALDQIQRRIETVVPGVQVQHKRDISKLLIATDTAQIKLEVNKTGRGVLFAPQKVTLCDAAQNEFGAFCEMPMVPMGQLYGGKICAALDRQHPRDLFDIKYLLQNEGFSDEIKQGFLLCLLSTNRPIREVIAPNLLDQRATMESRFVGMTAETFTYEDFEATREELISSVQGGLNDEDKRFLLSVKNVEPDWSVHDFEQFPAVQWKLLNLRRLKDQQAKNHRRQVEQLATALKI